MLTGVEDQQAMIESLNAGADDFVPKSSDSSVLLARLRAQLRRRQIEEQSRSVREQLYQKEIEVSEARAAGGFCPRCRRKPKPRAAKARRSQTSSAGLFFLLVSPCRRCGPG
jgi:DNA-binding NarL/FixJ family response regulator